MDAREMLAGEWRGNQMNGSIEICLGEISC